MLDIGSYGVNGTYKEIFRNVYTSSDDYEIMNFQHVVLMSISFFNVNADVDFNVDVSVDAAADVNDGVSFDTEVVIDIDVLTLT